MPNLFINTCVDVREAINCARMNQYDSITTSLVFPGFDREYEDKSLAKKHQIFSRPDIVMSSKMWLGYVIAVVSDDIDCESENPEIRIASEKKLKQEIEFAEHVVQHGIIYVRLKSGNNVNLARIISTYSKCVILIEVPMVDPNAVAQQWRSDVGEDDSASGEDTWLWWNRFRLQSDFNGKHRLSLVLSADIPSQDEILRWLGEPVDYLVVSSDIFIQNKANYPVLSLAHQDVISQFIRKTKAKFIVKANPNDGNLRYYAEYLRHLQEKFHEVDPMDGFDDLIEIPLQPLFDNLDTYTYEIFEKDPVKYVYYQRAIEAALIDKIPEEEKSTKTAILMVLGAGRGPLVRSSLNAATNTGRKVRIYVIEKNQNIRNTLEALWREMWPRDTVQLIFSDMRDFSTEEKADIIVSELLGSFGDNELSPECLDGAQVHLKPDGISIPSSYTSHIEPIMSSKLYNQVRLVTKTEDQNMQLRGKSKVMETTYVVYMKNVFHIADEPKPLFTFHHPNRDKVINNNRYGRVSFTTKLDSVLHGFAGYFDTVLYKDIVLSIHPMTHTNGLSSWFSMFIPISTPVNLKAGEEIELNVWRHVAQRKVWYEWSLTSPQISPIYNLNGRACDILM
ncbi:protein arginine N-methyltransferase 5 isoform X2 [Lutzomyia longipalpis]|uniref:protein arginine N-methyltransferase 5 isoform X2 n=1 Tax=Lutzomyia longipalpis TaxID=7200 RepID=UPI002483AF5D|nr:protein arginine N-methyltransferase 5 isoform X2 [Lutzomyia longipalpis]